ncbi:type III secretion protein T [Pseudoduganella flava]|uniref:EscT/YscT/HrcT family type III secretion system export apparatus protein n=1 Tax=Pseudoduganella flava TaxID=871742 RepID=A0A562PDI8_9BURK|nr:flagellar biosynthetic protein FliR [Pseudoduganella flava]QGZ42140.1 EscT/YscT/HrcT family type III secretion system export apparatus protein [Pseudoduganella flava]TWI42487.1 type III secretion protein T [Pseudoduganella flava]
MHGSLLLDLQNALIALALVTPRVLVCLVILPGFGLNTLTGMAKNSAAMAVALPAALPTFAFVRDTAPDFLYCGMLIFKEAGIGLLLGVILAVPMWVAQSVGSILDSQRSPIQIQANNASVDRDASAVGAMLLQAVVLAMVQAGLFVALARMLIESYGTWPAHALSPPYEPGHIDVLVKRFAALFWHIIVYGAPVLIPLILIEFAFAVIGVFASNLQVSFASSPIKSLTGLLILLLYWPTFSHYVAGDFAGLLDVVPELIGGGKR